MSRNTPWSASSELISGWKPKPRDTSGWKPKLQADFGKIRDTENP